MPDTHGILATKVGYDADTASIDELLLSSEYPILKYHSDSTGSVTVNSGGLAGSVTFTHSLGYVPLFICYSYAPAYDTRQRLIPEGTSGSPVIITAHGTSSIVKVRVDQISLGYNVTYTFRCVIFKDKIA